ncbi:MAG: hypothetical protein ACXAC7_09740 [Candidatus Hodarchaeales archaeon]|jgi:hypothetical protein
MKGLKSQSTVQNLEQEMILFIKSSYLRCKNFFANSELTTVQKKKAFLINECTEFFNRFKGHPSCISTERAKNQIYRHQYFPLMYKSGGFEFPRSFTRFMDTIKDANTRPNPMPDISILDNYLEDCPVTISLDQFFHGFFNRMLQIIIPLRKREVQVLRLLANKDFLKFTDTGKRKNEPDLSYRISPPSDKEILKALKMRQNQIATVERATNVLFKYRVLFASSIIMNPSKLGFYFVLCEDLTQTQQSDLRKYIFWRIPFNNFVKYILCVPFGEIEELLAHIDYLPLTHWFWDVDISQYDQQTRWDNFNVSEFVYSDAVSVVEDYRHWILNDSSLINLKSYEIEVIKNLSSMNHFSVDSLSELAESVNPTVIQRFLKKLVKNEVYQIYPRVNFIGIDYKVGLYFSLKDANKFENLMNSLLRFPINLIFTNYQEQIGLAYIRLPRKLLSDFLDRVAEFNNFSDAQLEINDLTQKKYITRSMNLSTLNFTVENGIAYLV